MLCHISACGFIAFNENKRNLESAHCAKFISKYGKLYGGVVLENFSYKKDEVSGIMVEWIEGLEMETLGKSDNLMATDVRVCGISAGEHPSYDHCVVLIMCQKYFDVAYI